MQYIRYAASFLALNSTLLSSIEIFFFLVTYNICLYIHYSCILFCRLNRETHKYVIANIANIKTFGKMTVLYVIQLDNSRILQILLYTCTFSIHVHSKAEKIMLSVRCRQIYRLWLIFIESLVSAIHQRATVSIYLINHIYE